ncbi:hypothetical protein [Streptomyces sp. NPDC048623]|uniref:hypothetical protein n=1 Tax=Streptomyces sp. NPDC048623 TaxID=3155761 RepID=UPI0034245EA4
MRTRTITATALTAGLLLAATACGSAEDDRAACKAETAKVFAKTAEVDNAAFRAACDGLDQKERHLITREAINEYLAAHPDAPGGTPSSTP